MATPQKKNHGLRPPKDPSAAAAAMRPRNALEKAAMTSCNFKSKLATANSNTICNTTSDQVGRIAMRQILQRNIFCVPIFQRRYCWKEAQWQTLLDDALRVSRSKTGRVQHSLGRLTCTNNRRTAISSHTAISLTNAPEQQQKTNLLTGVAVEGRSCILDGQQRVTTVTLLLAAIRDLLEEEQLNKQASSSAETKVDHDIQNHIQTIHELLFSNLIQFQAFPRRPDHSKLEEGVELKFARLVPTFCDRWSYYTAILPNSHLNLNSEEEQQHLLSLADNASWHRPLASKAYFLDKLRSSGLTMTPTQLVSLLTAILDGLTMLFFPVDVHQGHDDGTEDLMVIYERLALRDATFCKPTRSDEYESMDGSDMVRNLLLGSFQHPNDALDFYKTYWLPMERLTSEESYNRTVKQVLEAFLLDAYKGASKDAIESNNVGSAGIGGQLYSDFQAWFGTRMTVVEKCKGGDNAASETRVKEVGQELLVFAQKLK